MVNMGSILSFDGLLFTQSLVTVLRMIRFTCFLLFDGALLFFYILFYALIHIFFVCLLLCMCAVYICVSESLSLTSFCRWLLCCSCMLLWFYGKYCVILVRFDYNAFEAASNDSQLAWIVESWLKSKIILCYTYIKNSSELCIFLCRQWMTRKTCSSAWCIVTWEKIWTKCYCQLAVHCCVYDGFPMGNTEHSSFFSVWRVCQRMKRTFCAQVNIG